MHRFLRSAERHSISFLKLVARRYFLSVVIIHLILSGIILFTAKFLEIDTLYIDTELTFRGTNINDIERVREREVGYMWALNWTLYFCVIMPAYIFLLHSIMKEAREFLDELSLKRRLVYSDSNSDSYSTEEVDIWNTLLNRTARWGCIVLFVSVSLGIVQWYQYSGQWYFGGFETESFLRISTGVDWNVAGIAPQLSNNNGLLVTLFALVNYIYYGFGWALMFTFYIFLSFFVYELGALASARSSDHAAVLLADETDLRFGGFDHFVRIQYYHAIFSTFSVISLFLIALRNSYLPHECNVPSIVKLENFYPYHCEHVADLLFISIEFIKPLLESGMNMLSKIPQFIDVLFITYGSRGTWVLGPLFNTAFIFVFFIIISRKFGSIFLSAKRNSGIVDDDFATELQETIKKVSRRTLFLLLLGGVGAIFINFGSIMLVIALLWPVKIIIDVARDSFSKLWSKLKEFSGF